MNESDTKCYPKTHNLVNALFSCINFTVDSPLTKSIFGEHAIIISIHWIVMDLWMAVTAKQNSQAWEKEKEKLLSWKERKNELCAVIHGVVPKMHSLNDESVKYIYRIKASFYFLKRKKDFKKQQMKCLSYPTGLLVSQQQVYNLYNLKVYFCVFFGKRKLYAERIIHSQRIAVRTLTIFMNYWKLRCSAKCSHTHAHTHIQV